MPCPVLPSFLLGCVPTHLASVSTGTLQHHRTIDNYYTGNAREGSFQWNAYRHGCGQGRGLLATLPFSRYCHRRCDISYRFSLVQEFAPLLSAIVVQAGWYPLVSA